MGAVVNLHGENPVYKEFLGFINLAHHSNNTKTNYETGIRDFFREIKHKEMEYLTWDDVKITKKDVQIFRTKMKDKGLTNNTINNKVAGLRSFYYELSSNDLEEFEKRNINVEFFKGLKKLPNDSKKYDFFTVDEVLLLSNLALQEQRDGKIKRLFILFAADTSIRKESILNLKWSEFIVSNEEETVDIVTIDKGDKEYQATISLENYTVLLENKKEGIDRVFHQLTVDKVNKMMPRLVARLNIKDNRKLVFHSLRKTGVQYKYDITKDIKVAQEAANHSDSSLNVTVGTYLHRKKNKVLGFVSEMSMRKEDVLGNLDEEQLKYLIKNLDDMDVILKLEKKAKELFND